MGVSGMKFSKILDQDVYVENEKIGQVKDVYMDCETWEVTHFEVQLTKEAAREILGAKVSIRNSLSISALGKESDWCTDEGIMLEVSKAQLHIYLRPPE
jgi:sporulation protein YlmC with PRC-barrel domain